MVSPTRWTRVWLNSTIGNVQGSLAMSWIRLSDWTELNWWPSNPTSMHITWRNQNWKGHMHPNVHRSTIYNKTWKQARWAQTDEWIKKLWYINSVENYSAIQRHAFELVLMRWMNLEPIIQSDVSEKEKNKHHILMHISGMYKDGTDESVHRVAAETQTQRTDCGQGCGRRGRRWDRCREQHAADTLCVPLWLRELRLGLWNNLERRESAGGGREILEGGDICTPMVNPCWCMTEIKPIL